MAKEMLINVSEGEECRIALVEDGKLEELYMERTSSTSHVGNIYKGRVTNVEPSIQAAFIDFGLGRNGFLHISDLMPSYFGHSGNEIHETVGRKLSRRDRPPIQRCLRRGDDIIVQIIKEGIGTKGPTLTTYLSVPGRILVMMPGMGKMGVSRKIEDEEERRRLRQILDSLKPPKDVGFIIRTAGIGKTKTEIQRDLTYLTRLWSNFVKKRDSGPGPMELYTEGDLVTRSVRDVFTTDIDRIVVDNKDVAKRIKEVIKLANPRTKNKVDLYEDGVPLFHQAGIEREIEQMYSRHVPLPSGGSLVIDSTEAIVAIDVNSGKFREHADAETTAFKTDMEAADEIPRQLRLRDLGGVIICDFIDLRYERHRRELESRLHANFQKDRAKTKVLRMSQFGIIELTRQRMRPSLKRSIYFDCPHCKGAGLVKTPESMSLDVMRRLAIAINDLKVARLELTVCPECAYHLLNKRRVQIARLEEQSNKPVIIRADSALGLDEMKLDLFDIRDGLVFLEELGMSLPTGPHTTQLGPRPPQGRQEQGRGGRRDDRRGQGRRPQNQQSRGRQGEDRSGEDRQREDQEEDGFDIDHVEDQVEQREEELASEPRGDSLTPRVAANAEEHRAQDSDPHAEADIDREIGAEAVQRGESFSRAEPIGEGPREFDSPQDNGQGGGGRRRRRGRRGRGRGGRDRDDFAQGGVQPQEQSVAPGSVDEFDVGDDDLTSGAEDREQEEIVAETEEVVEAARPAPRGRGRRGTPRKPPMQQSPPVRKAPREAAAPSDDAAEAEAGEEIDGNIAEPVAADDEQQGRRRRRRGGRRRRGRGGQGSQGNGTEGGVETASEPPERSPQELPDVQPMSARPPVATRPSVVGPVEEDASARAPRAAEAKTLTRTGSADRHLIHDEPVAPQPMSRPRTYRDLDSIPDDFD